MINCTLSLSDILPSSFSILQKLSLASSLIFSLLKFLSYMILTMGYSSSLTEKDDRKKARAIESDDEYAPDDDPVPQSGRKRRHGNVNDNQHNDGEPLQSYLMYFYKNCTRSQRKL